MLNASNIRQVIRIVKYQDAPGADPTYSLFEILIDMRSKKKMAYLDFLLIFNYNINKNNIKRSGYP